MIIFYLFALVFAVIGLIMWWKNDQITKEEFWIGAGTALGLAIIFNIIAVLNIHSKTSDLETWSGRVERVEHHPEWVEQWEEMHTESYACGTDSKGNTTYCTRVYYTTEYDTHQEHWEAARDFGKYQDTIWISESLYNKIKVLFGNEIENGGKQPYHHGGRFYKGDNKIYATYDRKNFLYPCTVEKSFSNKIKATPNLFQFVDIKPGVSNSLYSWPNNPDWETSDRLKGNASKLIKILEFDKFNSRLGSLKGVNVILVGFGEDSDPMLGQYQQAAWLGGKKNDLVVCFGGGSKTNPAKWAYTFGWTESELVKRNLDTLFLNNPINEKLLDLMDKEIRHNYQIKDWHKFDYITIRPEGWVYWVYFGLITITQVILYLVFHNNDNSKEDYSYNRWNRRLKIRM